MATTNKNTKDSIPEIDIGALLEEVASNEVDVSRSKENLKALNNKGVSQTHAQRASKVEQSFINGLRAVGKYIDFK